MAQPQPSPTRAPPPLATVAQPVSASADPLAEPPVGSLDELVFTCGSPFAFPPAALEAPPGAENADHPAAQVLRGVLARWPAAESATGPVPAPAGWRIVVHTDEAILFLADAHLNGDAPYWFVELAREGDRYSYRRSGNCTPTAAFGALEAAQWELAPDQQLTRVTTRVDVLVTERGCASGQSAQGRIAPAAVLSDPQSITIVFGLKPLPGAQTCPLGPPVMIRVDLGEPLGERALLDGGHFPPELRAGPPTV